MTAQPSIFDIIRKKEEELADLRAKAKAMQWADVARTASISIVGNAVKVDGLATFEDADVVARVREIVAAAFTPDDSPQSSAAPQQPPALEATPARAAAVVASPAPTPEPDEAALERAYEAGRNHQSSGGRRENPFKGATSLGQAWADGFVGAISFTTGRAMFVSGRFGSLAEAEAQLADEIGNLREFRAGWAFAEGEEPAPAPPPVEDDHPDPWPAETAPASAKAKPATKAKPVVNPGPSPSSTAAAVEDLF